MGTTIAGGGKRVRQAVSYDERFGKILDLRESIRANREEFIRRAVKDIQFTYRDTALEVDTSLDRLKMYAEARPLLEGRRPLGGEGSTVALMLSYNGSAWLNTAITSLYMVGNRVSVKFSSKGSSLSGLTESIYRPIFGDAILFSREGGKKFLEEALKDPAVSTVVVFGSDVNFLEYESAFREAGKKMVFEGAGQDPFIVFSDADLDLALSDLVTAKFMYSGQTCTAPKRIFIHRSIYGEFLDRFVERATRLVVGSPEDPRTEISPVASRLAVARIREQLKEAVAMGAKVVLGGKIEGNLIHPTVVRDAADGMSGMREEVFGPVAFTTPFDTKEEVVRRAKDHKYGLRAALFGGKEAEEAAGELAGEPYCHPVPAYTFGKFGTVALNLRRTESWKGAFVVKPVGGYGYSGWIWETVDGRFRIKQGPKLLSIETSV
ncbi:aldehyde dehydrogenase family protein [Candidatus Deferrimicrobium sp.]|uniref:aldehyde dehydrogenase family protein n=1 Tax=Candidatus Deferrimicrobium sp. TaxID=3060586 RepID=UPI002ED3A396